MTPAANASPTPDVPAGFSALGLPDQIVNNLKSLGYERPTPIQAEAIPPLMAGRDLLGQAATGTGKTAAFALPLLARLEGEPESRSPEALILVPTRELAVQVQKSIQEYARGSAGSVLAVFGGQPIGRQIEPLKHGVDVVVATPGRALDHIRRGSLRTGRVRALILDEADEMLDMGFADELEAILEGVPETRQTMLFSATMPARIETMATSHMNDPVRIRIKREERKPGEGPQIRQTAHLASKQDRPAALVRVLDLEDPDAGIIFCRTRHEVDQLTGNLGGRGFRTDALHGGMTQDQRDRVMARLRSGSTRLLVATDVAARGLDVDHLTHVFNYGLPTTPEQYVHRIGRVGRAGRDGIAITIIEPRERRRLKAIEKLTGVPVAVAALPTVAELKKRRLKQAEATLEKALGESDRDLTQFGDAIDSLASRFGLKAVAATAMSLAHEAGSRPIDETEIAAVPEKKRRPDRPQGNRAARRGHATFRGKGSRGRSTGDHVQLFFSVGKSASVTPRDLVGAIANEGGISGRQIGSIQVKENFSLVDVPGGAADGVIRAMRSSRIKGRKTTIRRAKF